MTEERLKKVLEHHALWLKTKFEIEKKGERADLRSANLRCANLRGANLIGANLRGANLSSADLSGANLSSANLRGANLSSADLSSANLSSANLIGTNLRGANLRSANLISADLSGANLRGADLDFSCFPLWCGSLTCNMDDKQAIQILYHCLSVVKNSNNISEELKEELLTEENIEVARRFHRADECNKV